MTDFLQCLIAATAGINDPRCFAIGGFYYCKTISHVRRFFDQLVPLFPAVFLIKWDKFLYSLIVPELATHDHLRMYYTPTFHTQGLPRFYIGAFHDQKHYPFFDIEWVIRYDSATVTTAQVQFDDQLARRQVRQFARYFLEFWDKSFPMHFLVDTNGIKHQCTTRFYWSQNTRWVEMFQDRKQSYHLQLRCDGNCYFTSMEHLASYMKLFIEHLNKGDAPEFCYYNNTTTNKKEPIMDCGIYTRNRVMRIPGSVKDHLCPPLAVVDHDGLPDSSILCMHMHACKLGEGLAFEPLPRHQARAPRANRPTFDDSFVPVAGAVEVDPIAAFIARVLTLVGSPPYFIHGNSAVHFSAPEIVIKRVLDHIFVSGSPVGFTSDNTYPSWFRVCRALVYFVKNPDEALAMWLRFAAWAPKRHTDARSQFDRVRNNVRDNAQLSFNLHREILFLCATANAPEFSYQNQFGEYPCPFHKDRMLPTSVVTISLMEQSVFFNCVCGNGAGVYLGDYHHDYTHISNVKYLKEDVHVESLMRDFLVKLGPSDLLLRSNMGTGKTYLIEKFVPIYLRLRSVLVITNRRALAGELKKRLHAIGLQHYQSFNPSITPTRVIVQLDSINKLFNLQTPPFDLIVVDELESLLAYLSSDTFSSNRSSVLLLLRSLITKAKRVYASDADLGDRSLSFLKAIRPATTQRTLIGNCAAPLGRVIKVYGSERSFADEMVASYTRNENFCVVGNSKTRVELYERLLHERFNEPQRILTYTSDSDKDTRDGIAMCNELWVQYQVVMWSPLISSGVSFNAKHFTRLFLYGCRGSSCIRELLQQANRARDLSSNEIALYLEGTEKNAQLPTFEEYLEQMKEGYSSMVLSYNQLIRMGAMIDLDTNFFDMSDPMTRMLLMNKYECVRSARDMMYEFRLYARRHGDCLRPADCANELSVSTSELRQLLAVNLNESITSIATAPRIIEGFDVRDESITVDAATRSKEYLCQMLGVVDITCPKVLREFATDYGDRSLLQLAFFILCSMPDDRYRLYMGEIMRRILTDEEVILMDELPGMVFFRRVLRLKDIRVKRYINNNSIDRFKKFLLQFGGFTLDSDIATLKQYLKNNLQPEDVCNSVLSIRQMDLSGLRYDRKNRCPQPRNKAPFIDFGVFDEYMRGRPDVTLTDEEKLMIFNFSSLVRAVLYRFTGIALGSRPMDRVNLFRTLAYRLFPGLGMFRFRDPEVPLVQTTPAQ